MTWRSRARQPHALIGIALVCVLAWALPSVLGGGLRDALTSTALTAIALLAAGLGGLRAGTTAGRERLGWALLAASSLTWGAAEAVWAVDAWRGLPLALPSPAALVFVLSGPLLLAGIVVLALRQTVPAGPMLLALDGGIVASAVLVAGWQLVVASADVSGSTATTTAVSVTYTVTDIAAIVAGALMLARLSRSAKGAGWWRGPLPLLAGAAVCTGLGDLAYAYTLAAGDYSLGHPAELGYAVRAALLAVAAVTARGRLETVMSVPGRATLLAPYAAIAVGMASVLHQSASGRIDPATLVISAVVILLLVVRQILTVLEHTALTSDLEARVAARTSELASQEQWFRTVLQNQSDVVVVVDAAGTVIWHSDVEGRAFLPVRTAATIVDVLPPTEAARALHALRWAAASPGSVQRMTWAASGDDGEHHFETLITSLLDDAVVGALVLTTRDVTERTRLQQQLSHQAFHDELTGLPNRSLFRDRLDHAMSARVRDGRLVAVLFLDLDGFKAVNDGLGHAVGDHLLREVGGRLSAAVRPGDTVARLGGDEFAILLERVVGTDEAEDVARRLLQSLEEPVVWQGKELRVAGSLGLATSESGQETGDDLLRNADLAMYHAKSRRDGQAHRYHERMHDELLARVRTEEGLRSALVRNELVVHYQPTVDLESGQLMGVEALVRWQHPSGRLVPPAEFISVAEESGLIVPIGAWVLTQACRQGARWLQRGDQPVSVSVNVSGRQLLPTLVDTVRQVLAETEFPAHLLVLELTESILIDDGDAALDVLHALKDLGVRLAIDDFGTGFSSLSYLSRLPVDVLKVDRSFVSHLGGTGDRADLVRTIIEMGRALNLGTTAEGIESPEQLAALQSLGCDLGQGFLFSRPVPPEQVDLLLDGQPVPSAPPLP